MHRSRALGGPVNGYLDGTQRCTHPDWTSVDQSLVFPLAFSLEPPRNPVGPTRANDFHQGGSLRRTGHGGGGGGASGLPACDMPCQTPAIETVSGVQSGQGFEPLPCRASAVPNRCPPRKRLSAHIADGASPLRLTYRVRFPPKKRFQCAVCVGLRPCV